MPPTLDLNLSIWAHEHNKSKSEAVRYLLKNYLNRIDQIRLSRTEFLRQFLANSNKVLSKYSEEQTSLVMYRVTPQLNQELTDLAKKFDSSKSAIVRHVLEIGLEE